MPLATHYSFISDRFHPVPGESDPAHADYINPEIFAHELANFIEAGLAGRGYQIRSRVVEDWGIWLEIEHGGSYTLAVGCANLDKPDKGPIRHRIFVVPDKPEVRRWFRKVSVRSDVEQIVSVLGDMLRAADGIDDVALSTEP